MKITDDMIKAAQQVAPELNAATVRRMLEVATAGENFFLDGVVAAGGESQRESCLEIMICDANQALDYSQQLVSGARTLLADELLADDKREVGFFILSLTGTLEVRHDPT
jgi:hypothetical protein